MSVARTSFYRDARQMNFIQPRTDRGWIVSRKSRRETRGELPILFCFGFGVLNFLVGLLTLFVSDFAVKIHAPLKIGGLLGLLSGFSMLFGGAHLMDKAESGKKTDRF